MHVSERIGEWCKFSFTGTGVKWIGGKNTDHGKADVYLDGKLDATVDTGASSWLKQQEIYTKTGLSDGPHLLMIRLKTSGYQDFDAFEFLSLPLRQPGPFKLGNMPLPAQVPYLNTKRRYPLGNGLVMAVCGPTGEWSQMTGPGYTTPNFINAENLALEVDGVEEPLVVEIKRARETGVYYGLAVHGDLNICLIDSSCAGKPSLSRMVLIDNTSTTATHDVRIRARVVSRTDSGYKHWLVKDAAGNRCGFAIQADTSTKAPGCGNNIANKSVTISFTDSAATAYLSAQTGTIETGLSHLAPSGRYSVALVNYFRQDHGVSDSQCVDSIRATKSADDIGKSISDWQAWYGNAGPGYQLAKIKDERSRNLMEGALCVLKTNQSSDGGIIAHSTFYKQGYVRDAAMALRGLTSAGHFDESKQWLIWLDHKLALYGHIPDSASCEASLDDKGDIFDMGDRDVEEPGWVLLTARDYYRGTHDLASLSALNKTLQYCMDIQLKDAIANGYKLDFNGDETEICGAANTLKTGVYQGAGATKDWSLSSIAICAASLDFYIDYVKARGGDPSAYRNSLTNTTLNLSTELTNLMSAMDRDFWRTDVPEFPAGFHDFFRKKSDMSWPLARLGNFTLMPIYFGVRYPEEKKAADVDVIARYFDKKTGFLQLVPGERSGIEGHDLGYLLWDLIETGGWRKQEVYQALVNGSTVDCWGSFNEAYSADGAPNDHDLRSLETGINVSAIAKYWDLKP